MAVSEDERSLLPHAAQTLTFGAVVGALLVNAARTGRLSDSLDLREVGVMGIATHKLSRIVTRSRVTDFLRAPFTEYEGPGDLNEVNQQPRGRGLQRAMGELVACPFCVGVWVAGGFTVGLAYAPRFTRAVAGAFASLTVSDFLHIAYARAAQSAD